MADHSGSEKKPAAPSKAEVIKASKMPQWQKDAYLKELRGLKKENDQVPFLVYAKIRKIRESLIKPMLAYPRAVKVEIASPREWDEIFKNF